jgi:hypothetical protein
VCVVEEGVKESGGIGDYLTRSRPSSHVSLHIS